MTDVGAAGNSIGAHLMGRFGDPALPTRLVDALPASSGTPFGAARLEDETAVVAAGIAAGAVGIVFTLFFPFRDAGTCMHPISRPSVLCRAG